MNSFEKTVNCLLASGGSEYTLCKQTDLDYYHRAVRSSVQTQRSAMQHLAGKHDNILQIKINKLTFQNRVLKFEFEYMKIRR
jgi:hypothetical protein